MEALWNCFFKVAEIVPYIQRKLIPQIIGSGAEPEDLDPEPEETENSPQRWCEVFPLDYLKFNLQ